MRSQEIIEELQREASDAGSKAIDALISALSQEELTLESSNKLSQLIAEKRAREEREKRARELEEQLRSQELLLQRLEKQPTWIVYGAALGAALGSTLVVSAPSRSTCSHRTLIGWALTLSRTKRIRTLPDPQLETHATAALWGFAHSRYEPSK